MRVADNVLTETVFLWLREDIIRQRLALGRPLCVEKAG
jgi:hypothetical protein